MEDLTSSPQFARSSSDGMAVVRWGDSLAAWGRGCLSWCVVPVPPNLGEIVTASVATEDPGLVVAVVTARAAVTEWLLPGGGKHEETYRVQELTIFLLSSDGGATVLASKSLPLQAPRVSSVQISRSLVTTGAWGLTRQPSGNWVEVEVAPHEERHSPTAARCHGTLVAQFEIRPASRVAQYYDRGNLVVELDGACRVALPWLSELELAPLPSSPVQVVVAAEELLLISSRQTKGIHAVPTVNKAVHALPDSAGRRRYFGDLVAAEAAGLVMIGVRVRQTRPLAGSDGEGVSRGFDESTGYYWVRTAMLD